MSLMDYKGALQSRGVWGGLVAAGAGVAGLLGFAFSPADIADATTALASIASGVGGVLAVIGRVRATKKIKIGGS